jgi:hypothetical protein
MAQSAHRFARRWTVQRSNPDGPTFPAPVQIRPGPHPAPCTVSIYQVSFPWVKRLGLGADHPALSCAEVNIITSFHGLFEDELYFLQVRSLHLIKHHAMTTYRIVEAHSVFSCVRELRNAIISFVTCLCVRLSAWNNSAPTGRISVKFDILRNFEHLSRKFRFYYNLTRIIGTLYEDLCTFISRSIPLSRKHVSNKMSREHTL